MGISKSPSLLNLELWLKSYDDLKLQGLFRKTANLIKSRNKQKIPGDTWRLLIGADWPIWGGALWLVHSGQADVAAPGWLGPCWLGVDCWRDANRVADWADGVAGFKWLDLDR